MSTADFDEKRVHVRPYNRVRNDRLEFVDEHWRRHPVRLTVTH